MMRFKKFYARALVFILLNSFAGFAFADKKNFYKELASRRSNDRANYKNLNDLEFANFREVIKNKLYRSSSPVNDVLKRNFIADNAAREVNIKTFVNLGDSEAKLKGYKNFAGSYCSKNKIILLNLDWKYNSKNFRDRLAGGLKAMARSEPPFLIHCDAGKDRSGFVCALIEALMGFDMDYIVQDYLKSFENYFKVVKNSREYDFIADNEIRAFLAKAFNIKAKDLNKINLALYAENYFKAIGLEAEDIEALKLKLR
ncbi:MAG: tyrosine-protein phosphatase [Synergistaceae bacterium]|nr:tyrosine-protein phosphatase [Synergistaceae bacterium]